MSRIVLFEGGTHKNVLLEDFGSGGFAVQANQHVIIDGKSGLILDPGGHKVYSKVLAATTGVLGGAKLESIFLSHQDPDIVAAVNGWLMTTDATAYISKLWTHFVAHFGLDRLVEARMKPLPDEGGEITLGATTLRIIPAHFLHSAGNYHLYDPVAKILYSGDLGASLGQDYREVPDFAAHEKYMKGFHRRYMAGNKFMRAWAKIARTLDIETIAPQHGAYFKGKAMCDQFITWCENLECGIDLVDQLYGQAG